MRAPSRNAVRAVLLAVPLLIALLVSAACDELFPQRSEGEKLYRKHCAECHGLDAAGNTPGYMGNAYADLRDNIWKSGGGSSSGMESVVRTGVFGQMPPFNQLTRDEMRALLDHVRVLRGEKRPEPLR